MLPKSGSVCNVILPVKFRFFYIPRRRLAGIKFRACIFSKIISQRVSRVIMCEGVSQSCQYTVIEYKPDNRRNFLLQFVMYLLLLLYEWAASVV